MTDKPRLVSQTHGESVGQGEPTKDTSDPATTSLAALVTDRCYRCGGSGQEAPERFKGLVMCGRRWEHALSCDRLICFACAQHRRDRPCVDLCDSCVTRNGLDYTPEELRRETGKQRKIDRSLADEVDDRDSNAEDSIGLPCDVEAHERDVEELITRIRFQPAEEARRFSLLLNVYQDCGILLWNRETDSRIKRARTMTDLLKLVWEQSLSHQFDVFRADGNTTIDVIKRKRLIRLDTTGLRPMGPSRYVPWRPCLPRRDDHGPPYYIVIVSEMWSGHTGCALVGEARTVAMQWDARPASGKEGAFFDAYQRDRKLVVFPPRHDAQGNITESPASLLTRLDGSARQTDAACLLSRFGLPMDAAKGFGDDQPKRSRVHTEPVGESWFASAVRSIPRLFGFWRE